MLNRPFIVVATVILAGALLLAIKLAVKTPAPQPPPAQTPQFATALFMNQPIPLNRGETVARLLPIWQKYAHHKPTLLLLANNPHLVGLPAEIAPQVDHLLASGSPDEIVQAGDRQQANPLFLSASVVDIALGNAWFDRLAWALPLRDPAQALNLDKFRSQLIASQSARETETSALVLDERVVSGHLRGVPFSAAALPHLQDISGPIVLHIDLSYFQPLYKNEIATPLLQILFETLNTLRQMRLQTLAVTFSYGHLDERMTLDVRFLGDILAYLIEDPTRFEQDIPLNWQRQSEALYLANFFQREKIRDIYLAQEQDDPQAAWIKYNLYKSAVEFRAGDAALGYLAQAVQRDPLYALEYLDLSSVAYGKQHPDEALRMLALAQAAFPDNVQIKLQRAQMAAAAGEKTKARQLLRELQGLEWSEVYYPEMRNTLRKFENSLQGG